jgi:hypothetical protein
LNLDPITLQTDLTASVGRQVEVRPHDANALRIETPFTFADGDHLVIRLRE